MADQRLQELGQKYGGSFGGNGLATMPYVSNPNAKPVPKTLIKPPSQNVFQKIGAVTQQAVGLSPDKPSFLQSAIAGAGKYVAHTAEDIGKQAYRAARTPLDLTRAAYRSYDAEQKSQVLRSKLNTLSRAYGAGKVSKEDYHRQLQEINKGFDQVNTIIKSSFQAGDAAKQDAIGVAQTAVNVLSVGRYKSLESGVKSAGKGFVLLNQQPGKQGLEKVLFDVGKKVETALQTAPAFRELVGRNTGYFLDQSMKQLAGETKSQFLGRNSKNIAIGLLIKRPIVYQTNIGLAQDTYNHILDGKYNQAAKDAAWAGAQAVGGGPLGWFFRNTKKYGGKLRLLANGTDSFVDEVSKRIGDGSPAQIAAYLENLKTTSPKEFARAEKALRIAQEVNLQASGENVAHAAGAVTSHYEQHGIDLGALSPKQLVDDLNRWAQADAIAQKLSPKGSDAEYVAVRWDKAAKDALATRIEAAGDDFKAMADAITELSSQPGVGWGNNPILMAKITNAVRDAESAAYAAKAIRKISTVATLASDIPPAQAKRLARLGYSVAEPFGGRKTPKVDFKDTRKLVSAVSSGSDIFDETVSPQPQLAFLAGLLRKSGTSPESNTTVAYDKLSEALVTNLDSLGAGSGIGLTGDDPARGAKYILSRLQEYINKQAPNPYLNVGTLGRGSQSALQDVRQMNIKEIQEALPGTLRADAKRLQQAILKAYTDVPLEFRGLGVKASDYAYRVPGAKVYSRIQSALRYTYNPFFRTQEVIETKVLSHLKANNLVWMKSREELDRVSQLLDDSKIFTSGYTGEAAQDLTIGRIHANLLKTQRRDLAGLASDIAEKKGITVEQMVQDHPDELADALRVVVQYPTKGVLNSSLARTLNIAFFPMRYNLKVAGLVAKEVAKLPPTVQTAVIHSMFKMSDWMKSPEGIQWQSDHADAIQLFSYFLPAQNVASVLHLLTGKPDSIGQLGLLGGLPFGFISQILDAEGIIHLNTPYVDPKTGSVVPEYVPQTTKARAAVAVQGLINSMFTYPGRVIGLPGKSQFVRNQVDSFINTDGGDYLKQIRTEDLTPLQHRWIQTLSDPQVTQEQIDKLYVSPAQGQFNWYTLPPSNLPKPVKVLTRAEVAQHKSAQAGGPTAKPKALPIPAQGQTLQMP